MIYPIKKLEKKEEKIWRDLLGLLLFYIAGQLTKAQTRARGLLIIDENFLSLIEEVNAFYEEAGLKGQLKPGSAARLAPKQPVRIESCSGRRY